MVILSARRISQSSSSGGETLHCVQDDNLGGQAHIPGATADTVADHERGACRFANAHTPRAHYQIPSSTFASSLAIVRGSQRGVQTRLMSTSLIAGKVVVRTAWAWVLISGPSGQAGVVSVMSTITWFASSTVLTP